MPAIEQPPHQRDATSRSADRLRVTRYEQVTSMVLAMVAIVGCLVFAMLFIWLTNRVFATQEPVPVVLEEIGEGGGGLGDADVLEPPTVEELDIVDPIEETLDIVPDAVADQAVRLRDPIVSDKTRRGGGASDGRGFGTGTGSGRGKQRQWEVYFIQDQMIDIYARQLDYFGIELAVLQPENQVAYASNLARSKPTARTGESRLENRYYLTWRKGALVAADRELLARAGIDSQGRLILKFLPPQVEAQLAGLEQAYAGERADRVRRTRFGIRPTPDGYEFYVMDQTYR